PASFCAHCFGWNTVDNSTVFMPRRAVPASPGGECCRPGSASRSLRAPARCRSFARSDRPARSAALRIHARCERVSVSWRGSLALAPKRQRMVAPTASMNAARATAGPEFGLDLGRPISAVGEHIIAGVARVQQPIQLLAVVHGRIGHRIMPDQLVLGVRVHMVLVAEEAA